MQYESLQKQGYSTFSKAHIQPQPSTSFLLTQPLPCHAASDPASRAIEIHHRLLKKMKGTEKGMILMDHPLRNKPTLNYRFFIINFSVLIIPEALSCTCTV